MARILIVEDEPEIAAALAYDLGLEGYEVEVVRDGESASARGREPGWDLILLDVMMPKMDGFDVCRELRKAGVRTPILFLTARTHEAEKVLGLDLGADDYVTKPFSGRELARASAPPQDSSRIPRTSCAARFIVIDAARAEVSKAGEKTDITAQEFKLLLVFAKESRQGLSRDN
jgi:DNA-binding response OmpR family regulator